MCDLCKLTAGKKIQWKIYNLAFKITGKTSIWKRVGSALWQ